MKSIRYVSSVCVLELCEGDKVGADDACVLKMGCLFPPECLAGGECEG